MKTRKLETKPRTGPTPRHDVRRMRSPSLLKARAILLRALLRDARLERCVQMVP